MKRTVLVLAFVAALGMVPAHATKPFESQFTIGMQEGSGATCSYRAACSKRNSSVSDIKLTAIWVGDWEHSGFLTVNPNGTLFAFGKGSFTGRILGPDGTWYTGTVEFVAHTKAKIAADWSILKMWTQWTRAHPRMRTESAGLPKR